MDMLVRPATAFHFMPIKEYILYTLVNTNAPIAIISASAFNIVPDLVNYFLLAITYRLTPSEDCVFINAPCATFKLYNNQKAAGSSYSQPNAESC